MTTRDAAPGRVTLVASFGCRSPSGPNSNRVSRIPYGLLPVAEFFAGSRVANLIVAPIRNNEP